ncbi:MAG TPA: hypothetical protein VKF32_02175, partial [Thermoanaerobaculia bacterium]|nr:hypothetical protein [Thermoanaerobaculia bacterium]
VCPYDGPATVFENMWDTSGALQARYRDVTIVADVMTRADIAGPSSVFSALPGGLSYPYGPDLRVLHLSDGTTETLPDAANAHRVLAAGSGRIAACPDGALGFGAELLGEPRRARGPLRLTRLLPDSVDEGAAFNRQPDGASVLVALSENAPPGTVIVIEGEPLPTVRGADGRTLSAGVPSALVSSPGTRRVHLQRFTESSNELPFEVVGAATRAADLTITRLGPSSTRAGEAFNRQPDGSAALSVICSGASRTTRIVIDGDELPTIFGNQTWVTAVLPARYYARPGTRRVWLADGARRSNVAELTVTP